MTFGEAIRTCLRKYVTFSGRASRSEFWWFFLFLVLAQFVLGFLDGLLLGARGGNGALSSLFSLATFLPSVSASWRRMHDTGRSGLYALYPLIVAVGIAGFLTFASGIDAVLGGDGMLQGSGSVEGIFGLIVVIALIVLAFSPLIVIWWLTRPSQPGANQYGPNPHEVSS